jgi:hypothetical protein
VLGLILSCPLLQQSPQKSAAFTDITAFPDWLWSFWRNQCEDNDFDLGFLLFWPIGNVYIELSPQVSEVLKTFCTLSLYGTYVELYIRVFSNAKKVCAKFTL